MLVHAETVHTSLGSFTRAPCGPCPLPHGLSLPPALLPPLPNPLCPEFFIQCSIPVLFVLPDVLLELLDVGDSLVRVLGLWGAQKSSSSGTGTSAPSSDRTEKNEPSPSVHTVSKVAILHYPVAVFASLGQEKPAQDLRELGVILFVTPTFISSICVELILCDLFLVLPSPVQQLLHHVVVVVAEVLVNIDPPRPETTCIFAVVSIRTQRFPEIDMCMLRLLLLASKANNFCPA